MIGSAATIARLRLAKEPWTVNRIAGRAARLLAALAAAGSPEGLS